MVTLAVYPCRIGLTALTSGSGAGWMVVFLHAAQLIAGMGTGGEYATINSGDRRADPARNRNGWTSGSSRCGPAPGLGSALAGATTGSVLLQVSSPTTAIALATVLVVVVGALLTTTD